MSDSPKQEESKKPIYETKSKHVLEEIKDDEKEQLRAYNDGYLQFLRTCLSERERVDWAIAQATSHGFKYLELGDGQELSPGEGYYFVNHHRNVIMGIAGAKPVSSGFVIIGAHLDVPHIDLKPNCVDGKSGLGIWRTHYYGGIKKYAWTSIPLVLRGRAHRADGTEVPIAIGGGEDDPVFSIPDLLPHLCKPQKDRKALDTVRGEELSAVASATPVDGKAKRGLLKLIHEQHGLTEEDLPYAELGLFSGLRPAYVGLDRMVVGAAGQDDGVCCFAAVKGLLAAREVGTVARNSMAVLFDKEEVGSASHTGAQSNFLQWVAMDIAARLGATSLAQQHAALSHSIVVSADVGACVNPNFPSVHESTNAATAGHGVIVEPYTGARGKSGSSNATAGIMNWVRRAFASGGVHHQIATLGAVDVGGGGTIAKFASQSLNCAVVDVGPGVINMHSPFELVHAADIYMTFKAYRAFFSFQE